MKIDNSVKLRTWDEVEAELFTPEEIEASKQRAAKYVAKVLARRAAEAVPPVVIAPQREIARPTA